jgi:hypothetical protein
VNPSSELFCETTSKVSAANTNRVFANRHTNPSFVGESGGGKLSGSLLVGGNVKSTSSNDTHPNDVVGGQYHYFSKRIGAGFWVRTVSASKQRYQAGAAWRKVHFGL